MMKKPPGLWLLLSAGVLWLCFQDVNCVRGTSLIFGKSTTTTTTGGPNLANETSSNSSVSSTDAAGDTSASINSSTPTRQPLTGVPQYDYQFDPNLPRELNGYNLSEYPFYDRVPDEEQFDFKCDGLHDGFYASVPHKCQVYHHCLYGTRYDFLCANYTAFDQKTFICQFVSEVDCVNSKDNWHRNDALYQTPTTTTAKPVIIYRDSTSPPPAINNGGAGRRPQNQASGSRRRKPARRRRPQYDYYDEYDEAEEEYYDEPRYTVTTESSRSEGRRRNKRPNRPRPRPVYDDEYEEYEDERYDRRRGSNTRRGEDERRYRNRPTMRRNKEDRRKQEDEYAEDEEDPRFDKTDEPKIKKPKESDRPSRRSTTTASPSAAEERKKDDKRTAADERKREEKRPSDERRYDKRRQEDDIEEEERRPRPRKGSRRPIEDEYEEDDRRPINKRKEEPTAPAEPIVKSTGSSVYDRPRVAPKIRPPVPKSEADKYAYKTTLGPRAADDEEYYEDYEEEPIKKRPSAKDSQADASITSNSRKSSNIPKSRERDRDEPRRSRPKPSRRPANDEYYYEDEVEKPRRTTTQKSKNEERRVGPQGSRKRPATYEYDDYEEKEKEKDRKSTTTTSTTSSTTTNAPFRRKYGASKDLNRSKPTTTTTSTTTTTTTTTEAPKEEISAPVKSPVMRIIKRPFLPSRGGNPYIARGLQPIGLKSETQKTQESRRQQSQPEDIKEFDEDVFKPVKTLRKQQQDVVVEDYRPIRPQSNRQGSKASAKDTAPQPQQQGNLPTHQSQTQTAKAVVVEKNPLDINENDYDVTLNDALNPTLPNLPLRQFPSGFSNNVNNEYTFSAFHRPRYVVDATINQASSEYQYRFKQPQQAPQPQSQPLIQTQTQAQAQSQTHYRYEPRQSIGHAPQHAPQVSLRQPESHQDFNAQYTTNTNYQQFRPSPRVTHTQAFYATY